MESEQAQTQEAHGKCRGRQGCCNAGAEDHTCPYAEDINDDHETLCNCCRECQQECADDI